MFKIFNNNNNNRLIKMNAELENDKKMKRIRAWSMPPMLIEKVYKIPIMDFR